MIAGSENFTSESHLMGMKLMKKLNLKLTVEENSSPCLKFLTEITIENTRTDWRGVRDVLPYKITELILRR